MNFENAIVCTSEGGWSASVFAGSHNLSACLGVSSILSLDERCNAIRCNQKTRNEAKKAFNQPRLKKAIEVWKEKFVVEPENQDSMRSELTWQSSEMTMRKSWFESCQGFNGT